MKTAFSTVDAYIASFDEPHRSQLLEMRRLVKSAAPQATESISYGMPAYKWQGVLLYFGAFQSHIGLYPTAEGVSAFASQLGAYQCSKGAIQLPLREPLPAALISKIVHYRCRQNEAKASIKRPAGFKKTK